MTRKATYEKKARVSGRPAALYWASLGTYESQSNVGGVSSKRRLVGAPPAPVGGRDCSSPCVPPSIARKGREGECLSRAQKARLGCVSNVGGVRGRRAGCPPA